MLIWHDSAWAEYLYWQAQDKKTLKRETNRLVYRIRGEDCQIAQCKGHYQD